MPAPETIYRSQERASVRAAQRDSRMGRLNERRNELAGLREHDAKLARSFRQAEIRTLRAVREAAKLMRPETRQNYIHALRIAWIRPPKIQDVKLKRIPRPGIRPRQPPGTTFHFKLMQTGEPGAPKAHQRYIERDGACVWSEGNISPEFNERLRLWTALEERARTYKGTITLTPGVSPKLRQAFRDAVVDLAGPDHGWIDIAQATVIAKAGGRGPIKVTTEGKKNHQKLVDWFYETWQDLEDAGELDDLSPEQQLEIKRFEFLPGVKQYKPRETIVQRKIVLELAHELPLRAQSAALKEFCERIFARDETIDQDPGSIGWHAVIHRPENKNDDRNWHAHVVYTQCNILPEEDGRGWTFERSPKMPANSPLANILLGHGPDKRKGCKDLIKSQRALWSDIQNRYLRDVGAAKRYDPRSYRDQGIDRTPGEHLGPSRHALEKRNQSETPDRVAAPTWNAWTSMDLDHQESSPKERGSGPDPIDDPAVRARQKDRIESDAQSQLESLQLRAGLAAHGYGPGHEVWDVLTKAIEQSQRENPTPERIPGWVPPLTEGDLQEWLQTLEQDDLAFARTWRELKNRLQDKPLALGRAADALESAGHALPRMMERNIPEARDALLLAESWRISTKAWRKRWKAEKRRQNPRAQSRAGFHLMEDLKKEGIHGVGDMTDVLGPAFAREVFEQAERHVQHQNGIPVITQFIEKLAQADDPLRVRTQTNSFLKDPRHQKWLNHDDPVLGDWLTIRFTALERAALLRGIAHRKVPPAQARAIDPHIEEHLEDPLWTNTLQAHERNEIINRAERNLTEIPDPLEERAEALAQNLARQQEREHETRQDPERESLREQLREKIQGIVTKHQNHPGRREKDIAQLLSPAKAMQAYSLEQQHATELPSGHDYEISEQDPVARILQAQARIERARARARDEMKSIRALARTIEGGSHQSAVLAANQILHDPMTETALTPAMRRELTELSRQGDFYARMSPAEAQLAHQQAEAERQQRQREQNNKNQHERPDTS